MQFVPGYDKGTGPRGAPMCRGVGGVKNNSRCSQARDYVNLSSLQTSVNRWVGG
jgi:hypothetical protein